MKVAEIHKTGALVHLTPDELLALSNALNEVCNGLDIPEFSTRLGVEREEAMVLLKNMGAIYDEVAARVPHGRSV